MRTRSLLTLMAGIMALTCWFMVPTGYATTMVMMTDEDMAREADIVVQGHVLSVRSGRRSSDRRTYTYTRLRVQQYLAGDLPEQELLIRDLGGDAPEDEQVIFGKARYQEGETVIAFLEQDGEGYLRTYQMAMGKFSVEGKKAFRKLEDAVVLEKVDGKLLPRAVSASGDERELDQMIGKLKQAARGRARKLLKKPLQRIQPDLVPPAGGSTTTSGAATVAGFKLFNNVRWFQPDDRLPVEYKIDSAGDTTLGFVNSQALLTAAFAAWTNVPNSSIALRSNGLAAATPDGFCDGTSKVIFNDPFSEVTNPSGCGGILAIGGYCASTVTKTFNGEPFRQVVEGDIIFNNGWGTCSFWNATNVGEVATHELGHTLGFAHSTDPNATMYSFAHFDGRGASLKADDQAGAQFLYPGPDLILEPIGPAPIPGPTRLLNGDFEAREAGWYFGANTYVSSNGRGLHGVSLYPSTAGGRYIRTADYIPITPGTVYQAFASIKPEGFPAGAAYVEIEWRSAGGTLKRTDTFARTLNAPPLVWVDHASPLMFPPSDAAKVRIYLRADKGGGDFIFDDLYFGPLIPRPGAPIVDFNWDRKSEIAYFRPSDGGWWIRGSSFLPHWGQAGDVPVTRDYDGDGKTDIAYFRPSNGTWSVMNQPTRQNIAWGQSGDIPVPADYDGDGKADFAIFRPSTSAWWVYGQPARHNVVFGQLGDIPVPADYDGDAKADMAVFRSAQGIWLLLNASGVLQQVDWGLPNDVPTPGDYDGDGKADFAVFRPSTGRWWVKDQATLQNIQWGLSMDIPVPGDYDGDGKTDLAFLRPGTFTWWVYNQPALHNIAWGGGGDLPLAGSNVLVPTQNGATFVSQNVPAIMPVGSAQTVSVTMRNTGTSIWASAGGYRLGSRNPQNNTTWGRNRVELNPGEVIFPNQTKTFTFTVVAPATPGTYNFQWQMVQDGVAWFGASSDTVVITVESDEDTTPPVVAFTSPASGLFIIPPQQVQLAATASDNDAVAYVEFYGTGEIMPNDTTAPYSYLWNVTNATPPGLRILFATARDRSGNTQSVQRSVTVTRLTNGHFEAGQADWSGWAAGTIERLTQDTARHSSAKLTLASNLIRSLTHSRIPVQAGTSYGLTVTQKAQGVTSGFGMIRVIWLNAAGSNTGLPPSDTATFSGTSEWTTGTTVIKAPAGAVSAEVQLRAYPGTGTIYFDDVTLY